MWVKEATQPDRLYLVPGNLTEGNPFGYQYQWWKFPYGQTYAALGHFGQMIYVNPEESLLVVKLSYWPPGRAMGLQLETNTFVDALVIALREP
jgi:CubicO group peptidase (beta-lactamase class C family)